MKSNEKYYRRNNLSLLHINTMKLYIIQPDNQRIID